MLIIGSVALQHHLGKWSRAPKDIDYICTPDEYLNFRQATGIVDEEEKLTRWGRAVPVSDMGPIEFEYLSNTGQDLLKILKVDEGSEQYAEPDVVYTLKMSHRFLKDSPHFHKTMEDIHALRRLGCKIPDYLTDWYKERTRETYSYAHPKLNVSKADFFTDNINYVYDHDSVHESVKLNDKPAYTYFKVGEVECSKEVFEACPLNIQLSSVLEESYVLALERHQIPNDFNPDAVTSFMIALKKVCTSITSGWWRTFAWEHYWDAVKMYDRNYVEKFKQGIKDGTVIKL